MMLLSQVISSFIRVCLFPFYDDFINELGSINSQVIYFFSFSNFFVEMNSASVSSASDVSHDTMMDDFISKKGISVNELKEITQRNTNTVPT